MNALILVGIQFSGRAQRWSFRRLLAGGKEGAPVSGERETERASGWVRVPAASLYAHSLTFFYTKETRVEGLSGVKRDLNASAHTAHSRDAGSIDALGSLED